MDTVQTTTQAWVDPQNTTNEGGAATQTVAAAANGELTQPGYIYTTNTSQCHPVVQQLMTQAEQGYARGREACPVLKNMPQNLANAVAADRRQAAENIQTGVESDSLGGPQPKLCPGAYPESHMDVLAAWTYNDYIDAVVGTVGEQNVGSAITSS